MARIQKNAASKSAAAAPAKVAKLDKSAKSAKATPAKPATEKKAPAPRRSQWAGQSIKLTDAGKVDNPARNGALIRFNAITAHKRTDDAIGSEYTDTDGSVRKITGADIGYLVKRGLIDVG